MTLVDDRFPRWVETIELEPTSGRRFAALRAAAESVGSGLRPRSALALVEYAAGLASPAAFDAVQSAVATNDGSFAAAAADLEPRLVASVALARALERLDQSAALVAGAVLSAEFVGLRFPVEELPTLARAALAGRFQRLRSRVPPARLEPVPNRPAPTEQPRPADLDALAETLTRRVTALEQRLGTRLDAANEELDLLWWAFGAQPSGERLRWGDLESTEALLRTGRELADRHRFHAEVPSARELARRAIGALADEEFTLADVVVSGAAHVAVDGLVPGPLLPILTSAAAFRALGDEQAFSFEADRDWIEAVRGHGIDPRLRRRGDEITAQTLRELLLARALGDG